jgi:hypothetical protein
MKKLYTWRVAGSFLLLVVVLAACVGRQPATPTPQLPAVDPLPETAAPAATEAPSPYPGPATGEPPNAATLPPDTAVAAYPAVTAPADAPPAAPPNPYPGVIEVPQPYAMQEADADLNRSEAFVDQMDLLTLESFPPQFVLSLTGTLPTPCHQLRIEIAPPDADNAVAVSVYSLVDSSRICTQVLEPFDVRLPLNGLPAGAYTITVNDAPAGEIVVP